ncbi:uncharacterized protein B0H18DRAFT_285335 [Fomitopsis serialis]|uniref:uncharacterized protein n=1 Tax=Fomitopsis serialis TaxID=139415 RepID=UPI002007EF67|nr:uncharacterized protein B0H18DRAFT_285335 [Neoantrodia serialis]KAH9927696.1 hypothetical protein B0H18DRAFT_285335 [Neoantrodia serialis]
MHQSSRVLRAFGLTGRTVRLIDTPGFDDTTRTDTEVLKMIAVALSQMYEDGHKLSGIIYMQRISDFRMTGISRRNFHLFRKLCGEDTLKNVVIVTNMWGEVNAERGLAREDELASDPMFFKPALEKGAKMMRHDNTYHSAVTVMLQLIPNTPAPLLLQTELVEQDMDIAETAVGAELARDIEEQRQKYCEELGELQQEMQEAFRAGDSETTEELQTVQEETKAKVATIEKQKKSFYGTFATWLPLLLLGGDSCSRRGGLTCGAAPARTLAVTFTVAVTFSWERSLPTPPQQPELRGYDIRRCMTTDT